MRITDQWRQALGCVWCTSGAPIRCSTIDLKGSSHGCHRRSAIFACLTSPKPPSTSPIAGEVPPLLPDTARATVDIAHRHLIAVESRHRCRRNPPTGSAPSGNLSHTTMLITAATRGEFASSVADEGAFILLQLSPISNLNHTIFQSKFLWAKLADLIQSSIVTATMSNIFFSSLISPSIHPNDVCFVIVIGKAWISRSRLFIAFARTARCHCHRLFPSLSSPLAPSSSPLPPDASAPMPNAAADAAYTAYAARRPLLSSSIMINVHDHPIRVSSNVNNVGNDHRLH
ncbi:hypothetical protein ACLOJK_023356 [Asimina triloba]